MAGLLWRRKALLAAVEATYGEDEQPASADAILGLEVSITPIAGETRSRELERPFLGAQGQIEVDTHVTMEFQVELAGAGTAGDVPQYGALLRACGLAETIEADKVVYEPVSEDFESATIHLNIDGVLHAVTGARGAVTISTEVSQIPRLRFSFTGLFTMPTEESVPSVSYSAQTPVPINTANTSFTLHGHEPVMQSVEVELGNTVEGRFLVGQEEIRISDRQASGSARIDAPALSEINFFQRAIDKDTDALHLQHGTEDGNIVEIDAPRAELGRPSYEQQQGIAQLQIPLSLIPTDDGDDELTITVR